MGEALVYLVTGGCGFIGEHIVELLCKQDYVSEVRVFDSVAGEEVKKFATATTCVTVTKGDIRDYTLLLSAMRGVHVVIHTAAIVDYKDTVPFREMKAVNVAGTENVLKACCTLSIPYVVYTSSIAAVGPNTRQEPMLRGTEDTKYSGEVELPYGKTKAMAEKLVLEANGKELSNGGKLATCIICPNTVYGEKYLVLKDLYTFAKAKGGVLDYLDPEDTERNCTYVGNVAWMHVLAAQNLQLKPDVLAGQVYYSYDDTPIRKGFLPFLNLPLLNTITTTFSYETDKAFRHFGYIPLYSWGESKRRTTEWLKSATKNSRSHQHHGKEI
ncbi:3 beta-hydroxysteroid dehydrogenase type 7-like [Dermochelys coriacea]|uniref:3 beta-hydroxysteroid dehydrogenase type 7-like n=1 Tax=Dermochelys coriacea TaxID=27794 RepID=UPI001CA7B94F|nr:3 beta-hydroxysteroid dehydrogenase type 7-like [Dermochelys coriacea]